MRSILVKTSLILALPAVLGAPAAAEPVSARPPAQIIAQATQTRPAAEPQPRPGSLGARPQGRGVVGVPAPDAPVKCVPPGGESIPAETILQDLRAGKDVSLKGRIIVGSLDVDQAWPAADERRSTLRVVTGMLRLESCRIEGRVAFPRTVFAKGLNLACSEIRGDLDLSDTAVRDGFFAQGARIGGEARLPRIDVSGTLSLTECKLEDRLDLSGARVTGALNLDSGQFARDIDISKAVVGNIDLSDARVAGRATVQDVLLLEGFEARDTVFVRGALLESVRIQGSFDLSGASSDAGFAMTDCACGQDLLLDLATKGPIALTGIDVGRDVTLLDGQFTAVTIDRMRIAARCEMDGARFTGKVVIRDSVLGKEFSAEETWFGGDSEFHRVRFPGVDPLEGARFARAPSLVETVLPRPPTVITDDESEGEGEDVEGDTTDGGGDSPE